MDVLERTDTSWTKQYDAYIPYGHQLYYFAAVIKGDNVAERHG